MKCFLISLTLLLSGCSMQIAVTGADLLVSSYCGVIDESVRKGIRAGVAAAIRPNEIAVNCYVDEERE